MLPFVRATASHAWQHFRGDNFVVNREDIECNWLCPLLASLEALRFHQKRRNKIYEAVWRDETLNAFCVGRRLRFRRKMVLMWAL
jgi:hypothetical protein